MKKTAILLLITSFTTITFGQAVQGKKPTDFLPKNYVIYEKITGDLNKDGLADCILIIKATNKNSIIKDDNNKLVDRNRRGIIILFNKKDHYDL